MEIKLYNSPKKAFKLILVSSLFVGGALYVMFMGDAPIWVWFLSTFVCGGFTYPVAFFHLFDRRPQVVINEIGIFDRTTCKDFINWVIIQRAFVADTPAMWCYVCLIVDRKYIPALKKTKVARLFTVGEDEIFISVGLLDVDEGKLTEFILKMMKAKPEDRNNEFKGLEF